MKLIATVEIPNYVRKILVAKSRLPTYYKKGEKKIPKKYLLMLEQKKLFWIYNEKKKTALLSDVNGNPIIKNSRSVGTPRYLPIRGNDLHRLTLEDYERSKIVKAIKEQMVPYVDKLESIEESLFPLRILMEVHTTLEDPEAKGNDWDVDNHSLWYAKVFPDVLTGCPERKEGKGTTFLSKRIIPDDNVKYIIQPPTPLLIPIENYADRKLVFKIYSANKTANTNE